MEKVLNIYSKGISKIYRFIVLHLLWLGFTLIGLVVLGIFPATHALLEVMKEPDDLTIGEYYRHFVKSYFGAFVKINQAGIIWQAMFVLISLNALIVVNELIQLLVLGMLLLLLLCVVYFFEHFQVEGTIIGQIKLSFGYVFLYPRRNVIYMCVLFCLILAINFSPGITFVCGSSVAAHFIAKTWAV